MISTEHELARFIIENLPWSDDINNTLLPLEVQQRLMILVAKAVSYHRKDSQYSFIRKDPWNELEEWGYSVLQRVKLYDEIQTPLVTIHPIDHPSLSGLLHSVEASKKNIDGVSAYTLLSLSEVGVNLQRYNEIAKGWIELMINTKPNRRALRIMLELSVRFSESAKNSINDVSAPNYLTFQPHLDNILNLDTNKSFLGRLVNSERTIGEYTCIVSTGVCSFIENLFDAKKLSTLKSFLSFWLNEFTSVTSWTTNTCCMYILNSICKTVLQLHLVAETGLPSFFSQLDAMENFGLFPNGLFSSSSTIVHAPFFSKDIRPQTQYPHLSLFYLLGIASQEFHKRQQIANLTLSNNYQVASKSFDPVRFSVYRVLSYCIFLSDIVADPNTPLQNVHEIHACLPIYWQLFFYLYFEKQLASANMVRFFGYQFLDIPNKDKIISQIIEKLENLKTFYGKSTISNAAASIELYHAMVIWLNSTKDSFHTLINMIMTQNIDITGNILIQPYFLPSKLVSVMNEDLSRDYSFLWYDNVDSSVLHAIQISQVSQYLSLIYPNLSPRSQKLLTRKSTRSLIFNNSKVDLAYLKKKEKETMKQIPILRTFYVSNMRKGFVVNLADIDPGIILNYTSKYSTNKDTHTHADSEFISLIPRMYDNVRKQKTLELRCYKGMFCKWPGKVLFFYDEPEENKAITQRLANNRSHVYKLVESDDIEPYFCHFLLQLDITLRNVESQALGSAIFYHLLHYYQAICTIFPPFRNSLERILKNYAEKYIRNQPHEMMPLMRDIMIDPYRTSLLSSFFNPMLCPELWSTYLQHLYMEKRKMFSGNMMLLYSKFKVDEWLKNDCSLEARQSVIDHCIEALVMYRMDITSKGILSRTDEKEIFNFYLHLIPKCVNHQFSELYIYSVRKILQFTADLPSEMISTFNQMVFIEASNDDILRQHMDVTREYLWKSRKIGNPVYSVIPTPNVKELVLMTERMICACHATSPLVIESQQIFEIICKVFEPLIFPVPANSISQSTSSLSSGHFISPWMDKDHAIASFVVGSFVKCIKFVLQFNKDILNHLWNLYAKFIFPNMETNCVNIYNQELTQIDWSMWSVINFDQIAQLREVLDEPVKRSLSANSSTHRVLIKTIITSIPWMIIVDRILKCGIGKDLTSRLYSDMLCLFVSALLKITPSQQTDDAFLNLADHTLSTNIEWNRMNVEHFHMVLKLYSKNFMDIKEYGYNSISNQHLDVAFRFLEHACLCNLSDSTLVQNPHTTQLLDHIIYESTTVSHDPIHDEESIENPNAASVSASTKLLILYYIDFVISTIGYVLTTQTQSTNAPPMIETYFLSDVTRPFVWIMNEIVSQNDFNAIIEQLLQLLTFCNHPYPEFDKVFQFLISKVFEHPQKLSLPLFIAAQSVKNYSKCVLLMEFAIRAYLGTKPLSPWNEIISNLWLPPNETLIRQFSSACIEKGCPLTFFVHHLKRLMVERGSMMINFEKIVEEFVLNSNIFCKDQIDLIQVINGGNYIDACHLKSELYLVPVWSLYINLLMENRPSHLVLLGDNSVMTMYPQLQQQQQYVNAQSKNVVSTLCYLDSLIDRTAFISPPQQFYVGFEGILAFTNLLLTISEDRSTESTLSKVVSFFSKKNALESYHEEFKIFARALGVFLLCHTAKFHPDDQKAVKEYQKLKNVLDKKLTKTNLEAKEKRCLEILNRYLSSENYGEMNFLMGLQSLMFELLSVMFDNKQISVFPYF